VTAVREIADRPSARLELQHAPRNVGSVRETSDSSPQMCRDPFLTSFS
jgi:hypothetical protein